MMIFGKQVHTDTCTLFHKLALSALSRYASLRNEQIDGLGVHAQPRSAQRSVRHGES